MMDLPKDNSKETQKLLIKFLFERAEQEAEKGMKEKGLTNRQLNREINELNRENRTEYLRKIREQKHQ
ncbi:MAG: hypothetical protein HC773_32595 [Scytonema sp. CRU_2_7]|nr:hypothetical protein [Scytonema sp. CRU_2_7]